MRRGLTAAAATPNPNHPSTETDLVMPTAEERALQAKIAALTRWAATPPAERSRINKAVWRRRWENKVDPDRQLSPAERDVLVESAIREHSARMRRTQLQKRNKEAS